MIACGRHAERILAICEFFDFDGGIKDKILAEANAIQALLEGETERQRAYDRERKAKAAGVPTDSNGNQRNPADSDQPERIPIGSVVVEAVEAVEGVAAEGARRMPIPPVEAQPPSLTPDVVAARATERMRELSSAVGLSTLPARKAVKALTDEGVALDRVEAILIRAAVDAWEDLTTQGDRKKYRPALVFSLNSGFIGTASAALAAADRGESGFGPLDKWTGR